MSQSHSPTLGLEDHLHLPTPSPNPETPAATTTTTPTPSPPPNPSTSDDSMPTTTSPSPQMVAQYQSTLREAVRNGDSTGLRRLLEAREGKINLNVFDTEGQTALHQSCQLGNLELVKLLVKFGADVRLANRDGWSAVHIAAFGGHTDILLFLMTASNLACRRS